jgi:HEPN domain-containing protein
MDEKQKEQAEEWFERGKHDIEMAQLLCDKRGYIDIITLHIQQALEKYMKGLLVYNGREYKRTHDLTLLLNMIGEFNKNLKEFSDLCNIASKFYIEDRYPPGQLPEYSYEEIERILKQALSMIRKIKQMINL